MRYKDFYLEICADSSVKSRYGEETKEGTLNIDDDLKNQIEKFLDPGRKMTKQQVATFGDNLRQSLFTGSIADQFEEAMKYLPAETGLRIMLEIDPKYAVYPWEAMSKDGTPMSIDKYTLIVRVFSGSNRYVNLEDNPLTILIIASNVVGLPHVDSESEIDTITKVLEKAKDPIDLDKVNIATKENIEEKIKNKFYHIIHYIGHGDFKDDKGYLALRNKKGRLDKANEEDINHIFLNEESIGLMVFNACHTAEISNRFTGLVPKLIKRVPAIVSMRDRISNDAAGAFARGFYLNLLGKKIEETIQETRQSMFNDEICEPRDFTIPILFLGIDDKKRTVQTLFRKTYESPRVDIIRPQVIAEKEPAVNILLEFYDTVNLMHNLRIAVDYCVQEKDDLNLLKTLATHYKTQSRQFIDDYNKLTKQIEKFPSTYKEIDYYYKDFNENIEKLYDCFSTISAHINTIEDTMRGINTGIRGLYEIVVRNILKESLGVKSKEDKPD
jgi:hypothetical protein